VLAVAQLRTIACAIKTTPHEADVLMFFNLDSFKLKRVDANGWWREKIRGEGELRDSWRGKIALVGVKV
jgi:predicted secreted protein